MSDYSTFSRLTCVIAIAILALLPALGAHLAFLRSLAVDQPDLWRHYRRIAFTFEHTTTKHQKLTREVYTRISMPSVVRARRREMMCWRIFATTLLLASLTFGVSRLLELL
jgi:hypothetical protein